MPFIIGLALLVLHLVQPVPVVAAGRIQIEAPETSGHAGSPIDVKIKLLQGDASDSQPSTGEKAEIKIQSPESGQSCITNPAPSDSNGYVYGSCKSDTSGTMEVYAHSIDRGDTSEDLTLSFDSEKQNPTPDPSAKKMNNQNNPFAKPQQTQQGADPATTMANQPGLAEDKNAGQGGAQQMEGLQTDGSAVAGAATTDAAQAAAPTSDIDLLNSLIYLTGGIILLIAGIYFIYLQASKQAAANKQKKEENKKDSASLAPSPSAETK